MAVPRQKVILNKESVSKLDVPIAPKELKQNGYQQKHSILLSDRLAQSDMWRGNVPYPGASELFFSNVLMQYVDKLYPDAVGGPLYVDEPHYQHEIEDCKRKREHFIKLKMRYVYLSPEITEFEAMEQLTEQEKWPGQPQQTS